jgi:hypothetical protein
MVVSARPRRQSPPARTSLRLRSASRRGRRDPPPLARDGGLTDDALADLAAEYATPVSMEWVEELAARYDLQVDI